MRISYGDSQALRGGAIFCLIGETPVAMKEHRAQIQR